MWLSWISTNFALETEIKKSVITMKKMFLALLAVTAIVFVACASKEKKGTEAVEAATPILVAVFSAQGHTKAVAEKIAKATGGDLFQIEPEQPYTEEDLDGWNDSARGTLEARDRSTRPGIANKVRNFEQYDTIYLGFPIWWYTAPTIVNTFLESYNTDGKVIIPFATSGGSSYGESTKDLKVSAPKATFKPGRVLNNCTQQDIDRWVKSVK